MEKRLTADLNVVSNSNLEIQLLDGDLNIIQKLDDEPNDVGGLTSAELKAKFDESGNIIKKYINETLIPAVLTDDATEESRKQAEAARVAAEQGRVTAEEGRVSAESGRVSAEQARANAEASRVSAETAREAAETARADETAGIVARATAQANAAAGSASQAAESEQAAQSAANTATSAASSASQSAAAAAQSAASVDGVNKTAQSWAVGGTGTRPGEDTNNAKYWAGQAQAAVGGDFATKTEAQGYVDTHNQSVGAHADIRAAVAGSVRYDTAQILTDEQKTQARGNINAANGSFKIVNLNKIGWYRIATCVGSSGGGGILTFQHSYGSGGPTSLKILVTMNYWTPSLKCIDADYYSPRITNARIVHVSDNTNAIDIYYNINYGHNVAVCFIQTDMDNVTIQEPSYISESDALPNGETLLVPMEYLNPPMNLGVEYRTTERYLGKPVYVKVVDCGACPANGYKDVVYETTGIVLPIRCEGTWSYQNRSTIPFESTNEDQLHIGALGGAIRIKTGGKDFSSYTCIATVWYTKTTD